MAKKKKTERCAICGFKKRKPGHDDGPHHQYHENNLGRGGNQWGKYKPNQNNYRWK